MPPDYGTPTPGLAPLARGGHVPLLDGWRGLAILLVLQGHFAPLPGLDLARLGVDAFFALSGMLMSSILFVRRTPLPLFYRRRVARIMPAFLTFVSLVYLGAWLSGHAHELKELVATLLFLRTYWPAEPDIWHTGLPIGHLWSLNVEEHCYLLLSLLAALGLARRMQAFVLLSLGLATAIVYYRYGLSMHAPESFEIRTETAAAFVIVSAGYHLVRPRRLPGAAGWLLVGLLLYTMQIYRAGLPWWNDALVAPVALALVVNHADQLPQLVQRGLCWAPLRQLGVWSFSLYLWQQPFFMFKSELSVPLALLGALAAALASYYLVELPSRRKLAGH